MYVCMYVRMYVCMYVCTYVCMYVCMRVCVCVYVCVFMYACMYVCMYTYTYVFMYKYLLAHPLSLVCSTWIPVSVCVCVALPNLCGWPYLGGRGCADLPARTPAFSVPLASNQLGAFGAQKTRNAGFTC